MPEIGSLVHDQLIAGSAQWLVTQPVTVLSGQNVKRGEVMARLLRLIGAMTADGGNTGNGAPGTATLGKNAIIGTYLITCVQAVTDAGRFEVKDPNGNRLLDLVVAVAYVTSHFNVTLADGSTDFAVGDFFTIAVTAGNKKSKILKSGDVDGAATVHGVMANDVDATSGDEVGIIYNTGEFNANALIFDGSDTFADFESEMRQLNMHGKTVTDIAGLKKP